MTVTTPNAGDTIKDTWTVGVSNVVNQVPAGVNALAVTSGTDTTTSATYVNLAGTGSVTSFSFTKLQTVTRIKVFMSMSFTPITNNASVKIGVRINGVDYDVCQGAPQAVTQTTTLTGIAFIGASVVAAGTYTVQGRWLRAAGAGTPTRAVDNNWLCIVCEEVN